MSIEKICQQERLSFNRNQFFFQGESGQAHSLEYDPNLNRFFVTEGNSAAVEVERHNLENSLRSITPLQLCAFLEFGYLKIVKLGDNYSIKMNGRLRGGGPISGAIAYWLTKTFCYGTAAAGVAGVVVATGGVAGAVSGAVAASATAGASTAVSVAAGAITGAGLAEGAAVVTGSAVVAAGGIAGTVAAVESASLTMGMVFTAIPFLP